MAKELLVEIQVSQNLSRSTNTNMLGYKHLRAKKVTNEILLWEA